MYRYRDIEQSALERGSRWRSGGPIRIPKIINLLTERPDIIIIREKRANVFIPSPTK